MTRFNTSKRPASRSHKPRPPKLDDTWKFPNGSFYYRKGIPIHPTSDTGKVIIKILTNQYDEEK